MSGAGRVSADVVIAREAPEQPDVMALIQALDAFHARLYPAASNHFADLSLLARPDVQFLVARIDGDAAGCGAVVPDRRGWGEIKRMYVRPEVRGRRIGARLLAMLESAAAGAGLPLLRLETGVHNGEALAAYGRAGYRPIPPFGDYAPDPLSVFMEKTLG